MTSSTVATATTGWLAGTSPVPADNPPQPGAKADGDDTLRGGNGDDFATGQAGSDKVYGGNGNDELFGGPGPSDLVDGGNGDDFLVGTLGADTIRGGNGDDVLLGDAFFGDDGGGPDSCDGGRGYDQAAGCESETSIEAEATGPE